MIPALEVSHLTKRFKNFELDDVSFTVPCGVVVGMIGENGSGKSTTIRCILGQDVPDEGTIKIFGEDPSKDIRIHSRIGASFDASCFPPQLCPAALSEIFQGIYPEWDAGRFESLLQEGKISMKQPVRNLSRGMKARLSMAAALSHHPKLLILDEATSGLDPVVRESILDMLLEFMQDDSRSILMTSHITSDLEKIADLILFIKDGKIVFMEEKDKLLCQYGIARVTKEELAFIDPLLISRKRDMNTHQELLINDRIEFARRYPDYARIPLTLDDIVLFFEKGELA